MKMYLRHFKASRLFQGKVFGLFWGFSGRVECAAVSSELQSAPEPPAASLTDNNSPLTASRHKPFGSLSSVTQTADRPRAGPVSHLVDEVDLRSDVDAHPDHGPDRRVHA